MGSVAGTTSNLHTRLRSGIWPLDEELELRRHCRRERCESVVKARVRVLSHGVDWQGRGCCMPRLRCDAWHHNWATARLAIRWHYYSGRSVGHLFAVFRVVDARSGEDADRAIVAPGRFRQACLSGKQVLRGREIKFCSLRSRKRLLVGRIAHYPLLDLTVGMQLLLILTLISWKEQ